MKRLNEVVGLPVMCGGQRMGFVSALCLSPDVHDVVGLNVQRTFRSGIFVPESGIRRIGDRCVDILPPQVQKPRAPTRFSPACDVQGMQLGLITDAAIDEKTLRITALEISFGPLDDLIGGRRWVHRFTAEAETGRVVITLPEWERGKPS